MELRWGSCQESSSLRLWKWYATAYGNGMLPLVYLSTLLCNRLWKWYVTACLVIYPVMQPLMEMVCYRLSSYPPCYATAYGNGMLPLV
jgi:hypothetical protein